MDIVDQSGLIGVDFIILVVVVISAGISLLRGFFSEAISLVTWMVAFWVAVNFSADQAELFSSMIATPSLRTAAAFAVLFLVTLILGALVNRTIQGVVDFTGFGGMDHLLGILFGAARGVLMISVLVLLAGATPLPQDPWWQESLFLHYFEDIAEWVRGYLPAHIQSYFSYT
ncbi:MAG: CvpA family protein [Gammaproteobacteria bacterium]|jgi:membrane protein required for colicin V production|nr:CvpA family protein [Gammaproteobacteria bacterium]